MAASRVGLLAGIDRDNLKQHFCVYCILFGERYSNVADFGNGSHVFDFVQRVVFRTENIPPSKSGIFSDGCGVDCSRFKGALFVGSIGFSMGRLVDVVDGWNFWILQLLKH